VVIGLAVVGFNYYFQTQNLYGDISVERARRLIEENPNLIVVDVRTPAEFKSSHIKGSVNFCYLCDPSSLLNNLETIKACG
jgi:Rhodanese-related sulfurtransferase